MKQRTAKKKETRLRVQEATTLQFFLQSKMGGMTRNSVHQMLSHRQVSVNSVVQTRYDYALNAGDEVVVTTGVAGKELTHPKLRIVYEDDYIVVVEKKTGLLTVPTYAGSHEVTCYSLLKSHIRQKDPRGGIWVVHRLDRETSGLLVFAKTQDLQHYMRDYWTQLVTKREYVSVAEGLLDKKEGKITTWLTEDAKTTMVYSSPVDDGGKIAITNYKVLREGNDCSLIELHLETGRTNQIRVHLASIGHPVAGDRKYGSGKGTSIDRLALHARVLEFIHPVTEQTIHFETPIPKEFLKVIQKRKEA